MKKRPSSVNELRRRNIELKNRLNRKEATINQLKRESRRNKPDVIEWLIFTVAISAVPLVASYFALISQVSGVYSPDVIDYLVRQGGLLLVAATINIQAIYDCLKSSRPNTNKAVVGGFSFVMWVFAIIYYVQVDWLQPVNQELLSTISTIAFIISFGLGYYARLLR